MTVSKKDSTIFNEACKSDEPIIIFRAKDILSTMVIQQYINLTEQYSPNGGTLFDADLVQRLNDFKNWQRANPDKVKLPD